MVKQSDHFHDLDGMRGVLACAVMLFHLGMDRAVFMVTGGLINGRWTLCVDFFFILSGFVLAKSFDRQKPTIPEYFIRRLYRLAPLFIITTLAAAFLGPWGAYPGIVIANFAMIQSIFGISSVNGPGWSVPFELFFPLVALLFWRNYVENAKLILFIALAASAAGVYLVSVGTDILQLRAAGGLGIGFALYRVCGMDNKTASGALPSVSAFAAVILIMAIAGTVPLIAVIFPLMASATVLLGRSSRSIFSLAPFQALGRWSYGIYLTHVPIVFACRKFSGSSNLDSRILVKIIIILLTLSISAFLYRFLERPMIARGYRHKMTVN